MTVPIWAFWIIAFLTFGFASWRMYVAFTTLSKNSKTPKQKRNVAIFMGIILLAGIALFCGIRFSGVPEKLFPEYYQGNILSDLDQ